MALTTEYDIPYIQKGFCNVDPTQDPSAHPVETFRLRHGEVEDLWIMIATPYVKNQLQWAWRWRYKPSYVVDHGLGEEGEDVWDETRWTSWSWYTNSDNHQIRTIKAADPFALARCYRVERMTTDPSLAGSGVSLFDTTKYDRIQYAFRTRAVGSKGETAWSEYWFCVDPVPYIDDMAYRAENGKVTLEAVSESERRFEDYLDTCWIWPVNGSAWRKVGTSYRAVFQGEYDGNLGATEYEAPIRMTYCPCERIGFSLLGGLQPKMMLDSRFENPDYTGRLYFPDDPATPMFTIEPDLTFDAAIPEPTVAFSTVDGALVVEASSSGTSYTDMHVTMSWTDDDGDLHLYSAHAVEESGVWSATFGYPPFDVEVDVSFMLIDDTDYNLHAVKHSMDASEGCCWWSYGDEHVKLKLDIVPSLQFSPEGESVKLAGREDPVSRYGEGGIQDFSLTGTIVSEGGAWLPDLAKLKAPHDWIFRAPGGAWRAVRIDSKSRSSEVGMTQKMWSVDISMTEVDPSGLV